MAIPGNEMIVVIGASAGGVEALLLVTRALPRALPAVVIVVLHVSPHHPSLLPALLARRCAIPVQSAGDGDVIEAGTVYVAPPDSHLIVRGDRLLLTHTPLVNYCRPSIDLLFQSSRKSTARTSSPSSCRAPAWMAPRGCARSRSMGGW